MTEPRGGVRLVVDTASVTIAQRLDYDEFGQITLDTAPGFQPFGFASGLYDPDTKLTRFGLRDYDAFTGRRTTKDPIRFAGHDTSLYAYVRNSPVRFRDSLGLQGGLARPAIGGIKAGAGVPFPGGPGAAVGGTVGGVTGTFLGSELGPGAIATGIAGAAIGGWVGSWFDPVCAGSANCGEDELMRDWLRRQQMEEEIAEIERDLDRLRALLERLDRMATALEQILRGGGCP